MAPWQGEDPAIFHECADRSWISPATVTERHAFVFTTFQADAFDWEMLSRAENQ
jgi:hypothetical protein